MLCTSWNCVVDTGVRKNDVVAIWGAGPIGQMCADFAFMHGAARVIMIDANWRLDFVKSKDSRIETLDYSQLPRGKTVPVALKEMVPHGGPDVALECVAGEYAKGWAHYFEMALGFETDSSEIVNEMIMAVKSFGRCGITGVYVGYVSGFGVLVFWCFCVFWTSYFGKEDKVAIKVFAKDCALPSPPPSSKPHT